MTARLHGISPSQVSGLALLVGFGLMLTEPVVVKAIGAVLILLAFFVPFLRLPVLPTDEQEQGSVPEGGRGAMPAPSPRFSSSGRSRSAGRPPRSSGVGGAAKSVPSRGDAEGAAREMLADAQEDGKLAQPEPSQARRRA